MTWEELVNHTRTSLLDDPYNADFPEDNLWSNEELLVFANEATHEVAKRLGNIYDDVTAGICQFSLPDQERSFRLHERILWVREVRIEAPSLTEPQYLERRSRNYLSARDRRWKQRTGVPEIFFIENDVLYLDKKVVEPTEVYLDVVRLPIVLGTAANFATASPETPEHMHNHLANWIAHRAYLKHDSETYDPQRANTHESLFTLEVGPRVSDRDLFLKRNRNPESHHFARRTT